MEPILQEFPPLDIKTTTDYQFHTDRTIMQFEQWSEYFGYCAVGVATEAGELLDIFKKAYWHKHTLDTANLKEELGDLMFYIAQLARALKIDMEDLDDVSGQLEAYHTMAHMPSSVLGRAQLPRPEYQFALQIFMTAGAFAGSVEMSEFHGVMNGLDTHKHWLRVLVRNVAVIGWMNDFTMREILVHNIEKLRKRYPAGFSTQASIARVDVDHK